MAYIEAEAARGRGKGARGRGKSSAGMSSAGMLSAARTLPIQKGGRGHGHGRGRGNELNHGMVPLKPPSDVEGMQLHEGMISYNNDTNVQPPQSSPEHLVLSNDAIVESVGLLAFPSKLYSDIPLCRIPPVTILPSPLLISLMV